MADLLDFQITPLNSASVNVPRARIEARVMEDRQTRTVADFTGANALIFPAVLTTLSTADRLELAEMIAHWLVLKKAGL